MPITNSTQPIHFRPMMLTGAQRAAFARAPRPQNASNILAAGNRTGDILKLGDRTFTSTGGVGGDESKDRRTNGEATPVKKRNLFLSFACSAWSAITCLPKFVVGPRGGILQSKPDNIRELLESGDGRPNAKDMDIDDRLEVLQALFGDLATIQSGNLSSECLDIDALIEVISDDELMPRLFQVKMWQDRKLADQDDPEFKPLVSFVGDHEGFGLKDDGVLLVQGYHLSASTRARRPEDLHDALRRAFDLPCDAAERTTTSDELLQSNGTAGDEVQYKNHGGTSVTVNALAHKEKEKASINMTIMKAFGKYHERIPERARAAMANDLELVRKIGDKLRETSGRPFVELVRESELQTWDPMVSDMLAIRYVRRGAETFELRSGCEQNIHEDLRRFFGLSLRGKSAVPDIAQFYHT